MQTPVEWSPRDAAAAIAIPSASDDKYSRGVLGVATGSDAYPGAAVLGVSAALATGVGMVRYLGPQHPTALVLAACPEAVAAPGRVQAWLAGSGVETLDAPRRELLSEGRLPRVLDAGALGLAREVEGPTVVTPHHRELAALMGREPADVTADPLGAAREAAASLGVVVLLKGNRTVAAAPDGHAIICPPATPWLATAGTGDVLAGILGALVATHADTFNDDAPQDDAEHRMLVRLAASASVIHAEAAARASDGGPVTVRSLIAALSPTIARLLR